MERGTRILGILYHIRLNCPLCCVLGSIKDLIPKRLKQFDSNFHIPKSMVSYHVYEEFPKFSYA